jgi:hypothetical protein
MLTARAAATGGTDLTNSLAKASYRQRMAHFSEELDFLSEDDKDHRAGNPCAPGTAGDYPLTDPVVSPAT